MACLGECWDLGPPPDTILFLPPPPAPYFLQSPLGDLLNSTPCSSTQLCESSLLSTSNRIPSDGGDYIDLPRKEVETWSVTGIDDTWLLVLVASSIGVLLLGALLAMFLLKCREMNMFGHNECSMHARDHHIRQTKQQHHHHHEPRDCTATVANSNGNNKLVHPSEAVLYHGTANVQDNRMVWAALTPRGGTQHFVSENYPRDLIDYVAETEDHYETIDGVHSMISAQQQQQQQPQTLHHHNNNSHQHPPTPQQQSYHHTTTYNTYNSGKGSINDALTLIARSSFDNSGFVDYDYEDPAPLIESYQMNDMENRDHHHAPHHHPQQQHQHHYQQIMLNGGNTDMRCVSLGLSNASSSTLRRIYAPPSLSPIPSSYGATLRPRVSQPTRIEHPNLPPLNLYPHNNNNNKASTMKRTTANSALVGRLSTETTGNSGVVNNVAINNSSSTLPKYGC